MLRKQPFKVIAKHVRRLSRSASAIQALLKPHPVGHGETKSELPSETELGPKNFTRLQKFVHSAMVFTRPCVKQHAFRKRHHFALDPPAPGRYEIVLQCGEIGGEERYSVEVRLGEEVD